LTAVEERKERTSGRSTLAPGGGKGMNFTGFAGSRLFVAKSSPQAARNSGRTASGRHPEKVRGDHHSNSYHRTQEKEKETKYFRRCFAYNGKRIGFSRNSKRRGRLGLRS